MLIRRRTLLTEARVPAEYIKDDKEVLETFFILQYYLEAIGFSKGADLPYSRESILNLAEKYKLPTKPFTIQYAWQGAGAPKHRPDPVEIGSDLLFAIASLPRDIQYELHNELFRKHVFNTYYSHGKRGGDGVKDRTWFNWRKGPLLPQMQQRAIEKATLAQASQDTGVNLDI